MCIRDSRYGEIAYIGGGFGVGIHNTLEAAVYGIPVIFGPKYQKFNSMLTMLLKTAKLSLLMNLQVVLCTADALTRACTRQLKQKRA